LQAAQISSVYGLRLADGREVVVKAREDEDGRTASCVAAQAYLGSHGFPYALPVTPVVVTDSVAVHAEQWRPGGDLLRGDSAEVARRYAEVFARLMTDLEQVAVPPPLPNPFWLRWDHAGPGVSQGAVASGGRLRALVTRCRHRRRSI
jgi:hypothetical protein